MTSETIDIVARSFAQVARRGDALTDRFYERLFARAPALWALFPRDLTEQKRKLLATIALVVSSLHSLEELVPELHALGERHVGYGASPSHYAIVRDELVGALGDVLGPRWSEAQADAWAEMLDIVSDFMLEGAARVG